MANYIITYDLNGPFPTHKKIDEHIRKSRAAKVGRILETVWYLKTARTLQEVYDYVDQPLSENDRVLVVEADNMMMRNLLVPLKSVQDAWPENA